MNGLVTPAALDRAIGGLPEETRAEARRLASKLREQVVDVLAAATTEADLDLREDSAAEALWETSVDLVRRLSGSNEALERALAEASRQTNADLERWVRKLGADLDLYAARSFERTWRVLLDMGRLLREIDPSEIEDISSAEMTDPIMRDLLRAQAHALTVATLADEPARLPPICAAICARAHRALTSYIRFVMLLDPRESGLLGPRYRPLRHDSYRASEKAAVERHFESEAATATQNALDAALARTPEVLD